MKEKDQELTAGFGNVYLSAKAVLLELWEWKPEGRKFKHGTYQQFPGSPVVRTLLTVDQTTAIPWPWKLGLLLSNWFNHHFILMIKECLPADRILKTRETHWSLFWGVTGPPSVEVQKPNHWTAWEFPLSIFNSMTMIVRTAGSWNNWILINQIILPPSNVF